MKLLSRTAASASYWVFLRVRNEKMVAIKNDDKKSFEKLSFHEIECYKSSVCIIFQKFDFKF
jgi:hypothetical protein